MPIRPILQLGDPLLRQKALPVEHPTTGEVRDLVGDLALLGKQVLGKVVADRAGHAMHTALVSRILRDRTLWEETTLEETVAAPAPLARAAAHQMA